MGVQMFFPIRTFFDLGQRFDQQQVFIQPDFRLDRMSRRHPVHGAFNLATIPRLSTSRFRIVGATQLDDLAGRRVFDYLVTLDNVGKTKPNFATRMETEKRLGSVLHKVRSLI